MKVCVYSIFEPFRPYPQSTLDAVAAIAASQQRWAESLGYDYIQYDSFSGKEKINMRAKNDKYEKVAYSDYFRVLKMIDLLEEYDAVIYLDADLLPFRDFIVPIDDDKFVSAWECYFSSYDPEQDKYKSFNQGYCNNAFSCTKKNVDALRKITEAQLKAASDPAAEPGWASYGPALLNRLKKKNVIDIGTFYGIIPVSKKSSNELIESPDSARNYIDISRKCWQKHCKSDVTGINLSISFNNDLQRAMDNVAAVIECW